MKYKITRIAISFSIITIAFLLVFISKVYISCFDETDEWEAITFCEFLFDAKKTWSGYVCYYGDSDPPKTININRTVDGHTNEFVSEIDGMDFTLRIINFLSFKRTPKAIYSYMVLAPSCPEIQLLEISWDDGTKHTSIELRKGNR